MKLSFGIRTWLKNTFSKPNKDAIFIFGFQKSGTSAIAGLLAAKTGSSVTIDTRYLWYPTNKKIIKNEISVKEIVKRYSYPFSKTIIKEPATTFFIPQLKTYFKLEKYVFIVRNPFDNIRSILNRLDLPGNQSDIDIEKVHKNWRYIFIKTNGRNYISVLAKRWVLANNQLEVIRSDKCIVVKYEDFFKNKEIFITNLGDKLQLPAKNNISHLLNKQFQPKGKRDTNIESFYGFENKKIIKDVCGDLMMELGYHME